MALPLSSLPGRACRAWTRRERRLFVRRGGLVPPSAGGAHFDPFSCVPSLARAAIWCAITCAVLAALDARHLLSVIEFALLRGGVEPNPGPPTRWMTPDSARTLAKWSLLPHPLPANAQLHVLMSCYPDSDSPFTRSVIITIVRERGFYTTRQAPVICHIDGARNVKIAQYEVTAKDASTQQTINLDKHFPLCCVPDEKCDEPCEMEFSRVQYDSVTPLFDMETADRDRFLHVVKEKRAAPQWIKSAPTSFDVLISKEHRRAAMEFFAEHIPLEAEVPAGAQRTLLAGVLRSIVGGYRSKDMSQRARVIVAFMAVPRIYLRRLIGKASTDERVRFATQQLTSGGNHVLTQTVVVATRRKPLIDEHLLAEFVENERELETVLADFEAVGRATALTMKGQLQRAMAALLRDPSDNSSRRNDPAAVQSMVDDLKRLHPPGDLPQSKRSETSPEWRVGTDELVAHVRRQCKAKAAGPSGWTAELLHAVVNNPNNADIAEEIAAMVTDIARGNFPCEVADILTMSRLIGIPKPQGGTRPISCGEFLLKTAETFALKNETVLKKLRATFAGHQYGVSEADGAAYVIHQVRAMVRKAVAESTRQIVITMDAKNAFNTPTRAAMWHAVKGIPILNDLFHLSYGRHAPLFVAGTDVRTNPQHLLWSERGARQGTVLGPVFFALAINDALIFLRGMPGVKVFAYLDDVTIVAEDERVAEGAVEAFLNKVGKVGLEANLTKCEWFSHANIVPPSKESRAAKFRQVDCFRLLGAYIGAGIGPETRCLGQAENSKNDKLFSRLRYMCGPQGMTLLRSCMIPKLSYACRVHHPDVAFEVAVKFDDAVVDTWSHWASVKPNEVNRLIAQLPLKMGGLGLTSQMVVAPAAYEASLARAFAKGRKPVKQAELTTAIFHRMIQEASGAHQQLREHIDHFALPGSTAIFVVADQFVAADLFSAAMRLILRSAPIGAERRVLQCCNQQFYEHFEFQAHVSGCARQNGFNATTRHDTVAARLRSELRNANVAVRSTEPRDLHLYHCPCGLTCDREEFSVHRTNCIDARSTRIETSGPDLFFTMPTGSQHATDLTIRQMRCVTYRSQTIKSAFDELAPTKNEKYEPLCSAKKVQFRPWIATAFGHLDTAFAHDMTKVAMGSSTERAALLNRVSASIFAGSAAQLICAEARADILPAPKRLANLSSTTLLAMRTGRELRIVRQACAAAPTMPRTETAMHLKVAPDEKNAIEDDSHFLPSAREFIFSSIERADAIADAHRAPNVSGIPADWTQPQVDHYDFVAGIGRREGSVGSSSTSSTTTTTNNNNDTTGSATATASAAAAAAATAATATAASPTSPSKGRSSFLRLTEALAMKEPYSIIGYWIGAGFDIARVERRYGDTGSDAIDLILECGGMNLFNSRTDDTRRQRPLIDFGKYPEEAWARCRGLVTRTLDAQQGGGQVVRTPKVASLSPLVQTLLADALCYLQLVSKFPRDAVKYPTQQLAIQKQPKAQEWLDATAPHRRPGFTF